MGGELLILSSNANDLGESAPRSRPFRACLEAETTTVGPPGRPFCLQSVWSRHFSDSAQNNPPLPSSLNLDAASIEKLALDASPSIRRFTCSGRLIRSSFNSFRDLVPLEFRYRKWVDHRHTSIAESLFVAANNCQAVDLRRRGQKSIQDRNRLP
jgi:hypothetical protein